MVSFTILIKRREDTTEEKINRYKNVIGEFLKKYHLTVNEKKEKNSAPGEEWEFLGFSYCNGKLDISEASVNKLKGKMRRKARALLRWKQKKGASDERAIHPKSNLAALGGCR